MMKLKILATYSILTFACATSAYADDSKAKTSNVGSALTFDFGTLLPGSGTKGIDSSFAGSTDFATLIVQEVETTKGKKTTYSDVYTLTLNSPFTSFGSKSSIVGLDIYSPQKSQSSPQNYLDFSVLNSDLSLNFNSKNITKNTVSWTGSFDNISSQSVFAVDVTGISISGKEKTGSGLFASSFSQSPISPVPEPSEGALMLSGIGLLGFIASRRKNIA